LVYSDSHLNVLDLTLHFRDGFISTDVYAKPTDSHLYLPFSSSHPSHCKRAVPFGAALRIKRNCSTDDFLQNRCKEYKGYLKSKNYPAELVDKQFDKALSIPRAELLREKVKPTSKESFSIGARLQSNFARYPKSYQKALLSITILTRSQRNFSIQVDISRLS